MRLTLFHEIDPTPRKHWLVRGMIGAGELVCMFGAPGSGKSVLAGDLAAHIAAGRPWLGRDVEQSAVAYTAIERASLTKRRLAGWRKHHGVEDLPLGVIDGTVDLRSGMTDSRELIEKVREIGNIFEQTVGLIVIDTVSRALNGGDENSPKDMGALVANAAMIQAETGASVLLIHHIPADGTQRMRGHGALLGAVDVSLSVEKHVAGRTATIDKANDGEEGERVTFDLLSVEIAKDTTAPVVVASEAPLDGGKRQRTLARGPKIALKALNEAVADMGVAPPAGSRAPADVRIITREQWRDYAYRLGISDSDQPRARQQAFQRAQQTLVDAGIVGIWEPHVWIAQAAAR